MKLLHDSTVLVSAAELAEIIGVDLQTVNNWIRRDIISRTPIGGRKLRYRLFSAEEVYKTTFARTGDREFAQRLYADLRASLVQRPVCSQNTPSSMLQ
jgi:phage terminase Nu1 subunit (DNA packaging protein)